LLDQLIIDTERKVWRKQSRKSKTIFPATYLDQGSVGRGNNWAYGFSDDQGVEGIMDSYRKMTEKLCKYDGVMLFHSLAGGTGSGLGSRLINLLKPGWP
jgi:Tubulin/FtsZ family, GTPase domain